MLKALAPRTGRRGWYALFVGLLASIALCVSTVSASASTRTWIYNVNHNSGLCMSVQGGVVKAGSVINQYDCGLYHDQRWYEETSDSHRGWFYLQPADDNTLCATYTPGSTAALTLQYCGANAANGNVNTQLWYDNLAPLYEEFETIQGWAMSVPGASVVHGTPINIYPWGDYPDQTWDPHNL
jgi:hypothetical protein